MISDVVGKTCIQCNGTAAPSTGMTATALLITQTYLCNIMRFLKGFKNDNFQMKRIYIFLIFAKNIDCGYTLEPPY